MSPKGHYTRFRGISIMVLLAVLFLFNAAGNVFVVWRMSADAKHDFRQQLRAGLFRETLSEFSFSPRENPPLIDGGEELLIGDVKYDIISVTKAAGKVTYVCVIDSRETEIVRGFVREDLGKDSQTPAKRIAAGLILEGLQPKEKDPVPDLPVNVISFHFIVPRYTANGTIPTPPPRV